MLARGYLSISEVARHHCRKPIAPSTVWRWCAHGLRTKTGKRIRLRFVMEGSTKLTTAQWLAEFRESLAAEDRAYFDQRREELERCSGAHVYSRGRSASTRERAIDAAERALDAAGA